MEEQPFSPNPSFVHRLMESEPIEMAALVAMFLSVILIAVSPYLVTGRRHLLILGGLAICLGVGGYLVYDREHITLNLSMRDAQKVRDDCVQLLQHRKSTIMDEFISDTALPPSFIRLGAKAARITPDNVQICLYTNWNGGAWGFLYDPQRSYSTSGSPDDVRPTWYRDFYEFRVHGE